VLFHSKVNIFVFIFPVNACLIDFVSSLLLPDAGFKHNTCGLYYKPMMILNDDSKVINKLEASLTVDARVIIYDHHMFIVQATDLKIMCPVFYHCAS